MQDLGRSSPLWRNDRPTAKLFDLAQQLRRADHVLQEPRFLEGLGTSRADRYKTSVVPAGFPEARGNTFHVAPLARTGPVPGGRNPPPLLQPLCRRRCGGKFVGE